MGDDELVHNCITERRLAGHLPDRITFWDETLRDGERTPGVAFTPEEELTIATLVPLIKEFSESKSKVDHQAFIELFRECEDRRRGITEELFRLLAKRAGLSVPSALEAKFPRHSLEPPKQPGTALR